MKATLITLAYLCVAGIAVAQPSIEPWGNQGDHVAKLLDPTPGVPFEIVITLDSGDHELESLEFSVPDFGPYVLITDVVLPQSHFENTEPLGSNQFRIEFNGCTIPCEQREIARIQYTDLVGAIPRNSHFELYGFDGPGTLPRGEICHGQAIDVPMDGEVGVDGYGQVTLPGTTVLRWDGLCILIGRYCGLAESPHVQCDLVVSGLPKSITTLKSRFAN